MADYTVDTGDLGALAQAFAAAGADAEGVAASFRAGAGGLVHGDALGAPDVVAQYQQAFEQWTRNLDEIAGSMQRLAQSLSAARELYEIAERQATVRAE